MTNLICRLFGHDWLPIWTTPTCQCRPDCQGTYTKYLETRCRRCWEILDDRTN